MTACAALCIRSALHKCSASRANMEGALPKRQGCSASHVSVHNRKLIRFQARRVGGHSRSCDAAGATPKVERRVHVCRWQTPSAVVRKLCGLHLLCGFRVRLRNGFCLWPLGEPPFLLRGGLLLDLKADGIPIHLVRACGMTESGVRFRALRAHLAYSPPRQACLYREDQLIAISNPPLMPTDC